MMTKYEWVNLTQLGRLFGVTSHKTGKWLVACGLRTNEKKPSRKAFEEGFVITADTNRGSGYYYVWHKQKTVAALKDAGHKQVPTDN